MLSSVVLCVYEPLAFSLSVVNWHNWPLSTKRNVFCKFHTSINEMSPQNQDSQALIVALVIWFVMKIPLTSLTNGYSPWQHTVSNCQTNLFPSIWRGDWGGKIKCNKGLENNLLYNSNSQSTNIVMITHEKIPQSQCWVVKTAVVWEKQEGKCDKVFTYTVKSI